MTAGVPATLPWVTASFSLGLRDERWPTLAGRGRTQVRVSRRSGFPWQRLVQVGTFHWDALAPGRASRVAVGVLAPLTLGWASGHLDSGAFAALGALPASLGMAVSTCVGATTAATIPWLLVPVVLVWGYVTGLMVCLGPRLSTAAFQWSVALLIAVGLPLGPAEAAGRAGLVLVGGLLQGVLVAGSWFLRPGAGERTALAASYLALAAYASGMAAGRFGPPPPIAFPAAARLDDPNPLLSTAVRLLFLDLLEEAERLRAALAALAAHAADAPAGDEEPLRRLTADSASVLDLIAGALSTGRAERAARVRELSRRMAGLTVAPAAPWRWSGEALLGQLRAVIGIVARLDAGPTSPLTAGAGPGPALPPAAGAAAAAATTLRAKPTRGATPCAWPWSRDWRR